MARASLIFLDNPPGEDSYKSVFLSKERIVEVVELEDNQVFGGASLKWVVIPGQKQRGTIGRHISLNLHTLTQSYTVLPLFIDF